MYLLSVNLYEFGQFLQIILWISLPMVIIVLLITTYLHYRKKRRRRQGEEYGHPVEMAIPTENNGNAYQGLLWMKDKYEQYREQTDNKYEKLKEKLARSEQKYLELLAERGEQKAIVLPVEIPLPSESSSDAPLLPADNSAYEETSMPDLVAEKDRQIGFLHVELDQRIKNYYELEYQNREDKAHAEELSGQYLQAQQRLEAQQLKIDELNELLENEIRKVGDLTGKLECNMRLLLHIHQELDSSLHPEDTKIVSWT